jgi:hypothetical protein
MSYVCSAGFGVCIVAMIYNCFDKFKQNKKAGACAPAFTLDSNRLVFYNHFNGAGFVACNHVNEINT